MLIQNHIQFLSEVRIFFNVVAFFLCLLFQHEVKCRSLENPPVDCVLPVGKLVQPVVSSYTYVRAQLVERHDQEYGLPCFSVVLVLEHVSASHGHVVAKPIRASEE